MSGQFLGLRTCIYRVPDIAAAAKWYSEALELKPYFEEVFYVGFNVGGYELGLEPAEKGKEPGGTGVACYWGVEDVETQFRRLLSAGASAHEEPSDVGGGIVVATVRDPWGNLLGLIYNPHFNLKPDEH